MLPVPHRRWQAPLPVCPCSVGVLVVLLLLLCVSRPSAHWLRHTLSLRLLAGRVTAHLALEDVHGMDAEGATVQ